MERNENSENPKKFIESFENYQPERTVFLWVLLPTGIVLTVASVFLGGFGCWPVSATYLGATAGILQIVIATSVLHSHNANILRYLARLQKNGGKENGPPRTKEQSNRANDR